MLGVGLSMWCDNNMLAVSVLNYPGQSVSAALTPSGMGEVWLSMYIRMYRHTAYM